MWAERRMPPPPGTARSFLFTKGEESAPHSADSKVGIGISRLLVPGQNRKTWGSCEHEKEEKNSPKKFK